jgi:hypothetical protein
MLDTILPARLTLRWELVHMKSKLTLAVGLLLIAMVCVTGEPTISDERRTTDFEMRCGWFDNPTPGNIWLYDREAEWTIGVQGGYQVPGDWPWPTFKSRQWVRTNGSHGYGCACLQLRVNKQTHEVLEIKSLRPRPLAACRQDASLKKWKRRFK